MIPCLGSCCQYFCSHKSAGTLPREQVHGAVSGGDVQTRARLHPIGMCLLGKHVVLPYPSLKEAAPSSAAPSTDRDGRSIAQAPSREALQPAGDTDVEFAEAQMKFGESEAHTVMSVELQDPNVAPTMLQPEDTQDGLPGTPVGGTFSVERQAEVGENIGVDGGADAQRKGELELASLDASAADDVAQPTRLSASAATFVPSGHNPSSLSSDALELVPIGEAAMEEAWSQVSDAAFTWGNFGTIAGCAHTSLIYGQEVNLAPVHPEWGLGEFLGHTSLPPGVFDLRCFQGSGAQDGTWPRDDEAAPGLAPVPKTGGDGSGAGALLKGRQPAAEAVRKDEVVAAGAWPVQRRLDGRGIRPAPGLPVPNGYRIRRGYVEAAPKKTKKYHKPSHKTSSSRPTEMPWR